MAILKDFTLRQLQVFVEAARDENFRTTADRLGISQPSVSSHILALERKAGGRLFERTRGAAARLSALGEEMLEQATLVLGEAGKLKTAMLSDDPGNRTLRVAAGHYLIDSWIRPELPNFHGMKDVEHLELLPAFSPREMVMLLRKGMADIAFYTGDPAATPGIEVEVLRSVSIGLYGTPELARSAMRQGLENAPFLMLPDASEAERWQCATLAEAGIGPRNVVARSQYPDVMRELARKGVGLAVLFDEEAVDDLSAGRLARLPFEFTTGFRCMLSRERFTNPRKLRTIDYLKALLSRGR